MEWLWMMSTPPVVLAPSTPDHFGKGATAYSLYAGKIGASLIFGVRHGLHHCSLTPFLRNWPAKGSCTTSSGDSPHEGKLREANS
jgi:hypothetical protein